MTILYQYSEYIDYLRNTTSALVLTIVAIQVIAYYIYNKVINYVNKNGNGGSNN
jgi:hypothetical protein